MPQHPIGLSISVRNTKWLKNGKLRKAILSAFYNISQRNFGILLILWCSFKLWWNFCPDQNLVYNVNGPLLLGQREMFFLVKLLRSWLIPTIKKFKTFLPSLAKNLPKRIPFGCHTCPLPLLWHEFDNCLCNFLQSKVSCCLHMYFLWRYHLPPDKSENDQDSDFYIYMLYWHMTVDITFSIQYLSESCFGNDSKFLLQNTYHIAVLVA